MRRFRSKPGESPIAANAFPSHFGVVNTDQTKEVYYLTKPITPEELIARMRGLLERAAGSPPAQQTGRRLEAADAAT